MTCHEFEPDLDDYVDGTLPAPRAAAVQDHLGTCDRCDAMVADFRTLRRVAASLERRTPPEHVWRQLAARLHREEEAAAAAERRTAAPARGWRPAFAGVVMLALLAGASFLAWREVSTVDAPIELADVQTPAHSPAVEAVEMQTVELQGLVNAGEQILPGATHAAYRTNVAVIEEVIGESRAALASAPSDNLAQQSLLEAMRSKAALLQDMVVLINEMRKGNQDGAARIVAGIEP